MLDLSFNGGGVANAAVFTVCWFLGNTQVSFTDPVTGAESTVSYRADVNLDHKYDNNDNLSGLELYCLISPESFSSGNLVPMAFKADGRVTLLGKTSGGGSCIVRRLTTAWRTCFQISGASRISFVKNGAFYDVDRGVDPDCYQPVLHKKQQCKAIDVNPGAEARECRRYCNKSQRRFPDRRKAR